MTRRIDIHAHFFPRVTRDPRELPVAMFDSGVGGLTVLHECLVSLPEEDFLSICLEIRDYLVEHQADLEALRRRNQQEHFQERRQDQREPR